MSSLAEATDKRYVKLGRTPQTSEYVGKVTTLAKDRIKRKVGSGEQATL
jgi:hypothetical protein